MKKDAFYFSHDSNARNDIKMIKLRRNLGMEGVGIFWCLIEILRENQSNKLKISDLRDISYDFQVKEELIKEVVNNYGLFKISGDQFYSQRLCKSMSYWNKSKRVLSDAGKKGNAIRWRSGGDGQVIAIKGKEIKEKKKGLSGELPVGMI